MSACAAVPHAVDRCRARVARRRADDRDPPALLRQDVFEQPPDQLQGDVLERQCRTVEQLLHEVLVADLHEWGDGRMSKRRIGIGAHRGQVGRGDLIADERLHDLCGARRIAHAVGRRRKARPLRRHVQPTIGCQTGEQRLGETELGGLPAGGDVPHVSHRSHAAAHRRCGPRRGRAARARSLEPMTRGLRG